MCHAVVNRVSSIPAFFGSVQLAGWPAHIRLFVRTAAGPIQAFRRLVQPIVSRNTHESFWNESLHASPLHASEFDDLSSFRIWPDPINVQPRSRPGKGVSDGSCFNTSPAVNHSLHAVCC